MANVLEVALFVNNNIFPLLSSTVKFPWILMLTLNAKSADWPVLFHVRLPKLCAIPAGIAFVTPVISHVDVTFQFAVGMVPQFWSIIETTTREKPD